MGPGRGARTRKQKGESKWGVVRLTNPGQVAPWHRYPEITFFLGCRELNTFPRKTSTLQSGLGSAPGEEPGAEGQRSVTSYQVLSALDPRI